jgi:hypothetical protein
MHVGLCAPAEVIKRAPAQLCFEESLNLLFKVRSNKAFMSECRPSPNARGVVRMSAFRGRRSHPKLERPCPPVTLSRPARAGDRCPLRAEERTWSLASRLTSPGDLLFACRQGRAVHLVFESHGMQRPLCRFRREARTASDVAPDDG